MTRQRIQHVDLSAFRLGELHEPLEADSRDEISTATNALVGLATQRIDIVSRNLDTAVYDQQPLLDNLRSFVTARRRANVRILVKSPAPLVSRGHRLIELARRLSSFIEIRSPAPEHDTYNAAFVVVDGVGSLYQGLADRYEGVLSLCDRFHARELERQFEGMWTTATTPADLRRMHL